MNKKKSLYKNKIIIAIILIIVILLIIFGTRGYLYIRVLIGNDLMTKIEADKENIFLKNGESDKIKVTSYALTNIFCNAECNSRFIDLSSGETLEEDSFTLKLSKTKEFIINASNLGSGLKIYRFDLGCASPKTLLCETNGKIKKSSILITLNYKLNDTEKSLKPRLNYELNTFFTKIKYYNDLLNEFDKSIRGLEESTNVDLLRERLDKNKDILVNINKSSENLLYLWNKEDYVSLNNKFENFNKGFTVYEIGFLSFNDSVYSNVSQYNNIIDNIVYLNEKIENLKKLNMTQNSSEKLDFLIDEYNHLLVDLLKKDNLSDKSSLVEVFKNKTLNFSFELSNFTRFTKNFSIFNLSKIYISEQNKTNINISSPIEQFCINNDCSKSCDSRCYIKEGKYPIILLHGHSFNEKVSAEASLDSFENIQRDLEDYDYLNAGSLLISNSNNYTNGVWQKINIPLTIKTSYYFDILTNEGKNIVIQTKTDNLDTYTLRLKDIISEVKSKTNRKKVIIIAHSMGGLIARRYLQVFGEEDIDKLILITSPNKGIFGNTLTLCPVFGTKSECNDMDKNSLFINKLNNAQVPHVPIYNIMGLGCVTNGENSDGVIINSSQYLEYAANYYINGTCDNTNFKYLHTEILNPEKYPEIVKLITEILKDNSSIVNI